MSDPHPNPHDQVLLAAMFVEKRCIRHQHRSLHASRPIILEMERQKKWRVIPRSLMRSKPPSTPCERTKELRNFFTLGRSGARTPLSMVSPASMPIDQESAATSLRLRPKLEAALGDGYELGAAVCQGSCVSLRSGAFSLCLSVDRSVPSPPGLPCEAARQQPAYQGSARQLTKTAVGG